MKRKKQYWLYAGVLLAVFNLACCNGAKPGQSYRRILPPPLSLNMNTAAECSRRKKIKPDSTYNDNVFLICDSLDAYDWILTDYLLHKKYGLLTRVAVDSKDTACLRPFYDQVVQNKFHKDRASIMAEIKQEALLLQQQIGADQIRKGLYYRADRFPEYPDSRSNLYFEILRLQDSLGMKSDRNGTVVFYLNIDTSGNVAAVEIYQHLDPKTDSMTVLLMKNLPSKWMPAMTKGKKVNFWLQYGVQWTKH